MPSVLVGFSGKMPTFYRQKPVRPFAMADNYLGKKFEDIGEKPSQDGSEKDESFP